MGRCPGELEYLNHLKGAGVQISLADYRTLAALDRDDLILWNESEVQRLQDDAELAKKGEGDGC